MKKSSNFPPKPWTNPLAKMQILPLFHFNIFIVLKSKFSIHNIMKDSSGPVWSEKKENEKISNFWPKPWTNLLAENANFATFLIQYFYCVERLIFYLERYVPIWSKKQRIKTFQIFDQNHGLTPWQKCKFCIFFKLILWSSTKAYFLSRTS